MIEPPLIIGTVTAVGSIAAVVIKWQYDKRSKSGRIRDTEAEKLWDVQEQLRKAYQEYGESLQKKLAEAEEELATVRKSTTALMEEANRIKLLNATMVEDLMRAKIDLQACHAELLSTRRKLRRALKTLDGYTSDTKSRKTI